MTNICLHEALNVMNEVWLPRVLVIHTRVLVIHTRVLVIHASAISFVLYRDKSQTKTMKNDLGFYVGSLTI